MFVAAALPEGAPYYVRNFETLLDTLVRRDGDLLADDEREFVERYSELPRDARALLVRLATRKGPLFRASRLVYPEIPDLRASVEPLIACGWVELDPAMTLDEIFRLFRGDEIAGFAVFGPRERGRTKGQWLESLRAAAPATLAPADLGLASGSIYRLSVGALCSRLSGMFFGNFRQDLSEFVLADLGILRYERVLLEPGSRPFPSRAHVEAFHGLQRCREEFEAGLCPEVIERGLPPSLPGCDWLEARRDRLRWRLGQECERRGQIAGALRLYDDCAHPDAQARARRLEARAAGGGPSGRAASSPGIPSFELALAELDGGRGVEHRVRDHLSAAEPLDTCVHYVENSLINTLFGLLCWPAIFAPVRGAFFHAFHPGPADLSCAGFFARRRREFDACFVELHSGAYRGTIRERYAEKRGVISPFVAWEAVDEPLLERALACFPPAHLLAWCEWIAADVRANRSGFPDLVQFWPASRTYRLIEVKGPGDRLQDNQRRCLQHCLGQGIPVTVCRVHRAGDGEVQSVPGT